MRAVIVGHGPSMLVEPMGKLIDEFDVVIRLKRCQETLTMPEYYGTKTDIVGGSLNISGQLKGIGGATTYWIFVDSRHEKAHPDMLMAAIQYLARPDYLVPLKPVNVKPTQNEVAPRGEGTLQVRESEARWAEKLPGLSRSEYAELAQISPLNPGSEEEGHLSELCQRLFAEGKTPAEALREVRKYRGADASPGLRQAARSDMAMPGMPSDPTSNTVLLDKPLCDAWDAKYRVLRDLLGERGHPHTSQGMKAIIYALAHLKPDELVLAGFDNVMSGEFTWSITRGPDWKHYPDHNWRTEHELLKQLEAAFPNTKIGFLLPEAQDDQSSNQLLG